MPSRRDRRAVTSRLRSVSARPSLNDGGGSEELSMPGLPPRQWAWSLVLMAGLVLVLMALVPQLAHWSNDYSEPVRAQVTESRLVRAPGWLGLVRGRAEFRYRYIHDGTVFAGSAYRPGGGQNDAVQRLGPGAIITVYVDPDHPERALVQPGLARSQAAQIGLGLVALLLAGFRLTRPDQRSTPNTTQT